MYNQIGANSKALFISHHRDLQKLPVFQGTTDGAFHVHEVREHHEHVRQGRVSLSEHPRAAGSGREGPSGGGRTHHYQRHHQLDGRSQTPNVQLVDGIEIVTYM